MARCTRLESLTIAQVSIETLHAYELLPPGWYYPGPEIHEELSSFIQSVQPRYLRIQYDDVSMSVRSELKSLWMKNTCRGNCPYHKHFDQKLLPVLREGWPELRRLELTYWLITEADMLGLAVRDQAAPFLGDRTEVKISTLPRTFYRYRLNSSD